MSANAIPAEIAEVLSLAVLNNGEHELLRQVLELQPALSDRLELDPAPAERIEPIARVERIEPADTVLVPGEDEIEVPTPGLVPHREERVPSLGRVAADSGVDVLADDPVAVGVSVLEELGPLVFDRRLLPVARHPEIANRSNRTVAVGRIGDSH